MSSSASAPVLELANSPMSPPTPAPIKDKGETAEPGQSPRTRQALHAFSAFVREQVLPRTSESDAAPDQPFWLADDFLRALALLLMAWAWDRMATAPNADAAAHAAFWRWVWPEFDMRMGMMNTTLTAGQRAPAML